MLRAGAVGIGCALLLAGCGGGSGGGSDAPPEATIDAASAPVITADVLLGLELSGEFAAVGGSPGPPTSLSALGSAVVRSVAVAPAVVFPPTTEDCLSGTVTIAGDVANPDTFTGGDRLELDFDDCVLEPGGPTFDGSFDFVVFTFQGDFDEEFSLTVNATFTDFTLTDDPDEPDELVREANGSARLSHDTLTPNVVALELETGPITLSEDETDISLRSFDNILNVNTSDDAYELAGVGTLSSSRFVGRVDYQTGELDSLEGVLPAPPAEGELVIIGAQNATITVLPDGDDVVLELDLDGDEDVDETIETTWDAIFAAEPPAPVGTTASP